MRVPTAEEIGARIMERMANARRLEAADPAMRRSKAHEVADLVFAHDFDYALRGRS